MSPAAPAPFPIFPALHPLPLPAAVIRVERAGDGRWDVSPRVHLVPLQRGLTQPILQEPCRPRRSRAVHALPPTSSSLSGRI